VRAPCKDCGMETEPWPPRRGTQEHYIVKDSVWQAAGMPPGKMDPDNHLAIHGGGILCVGCIEKRLGRMLTIDDFPPLVHDLLKGSENTPRLLSRAGIASFAVAHKPLPDHVVDEWLASTIKNVMRDRNPRIKDVEVDNDEVILFDGKEATLYRAGPELMAMREAMRWHRDKQMGDGTIDLLAWE
jgi:hypothetical protein